MNDEQTALPHEAPVFPLPDVVLFPRQLMPLHIFEPRYRKMIADCLDGNQFLAIALLKPDFEQTYLTPRAPIHRVVGVGRIVRAHSVEDGKFNIIVRGEARARIVEERDPRPYRVALLEPLPSTSILTVSEACSLRGDLRAAINAAFHDCEDGYRNLVKLLDSPVCLGDVADLVASGLPTAGELRQTLLEETDIGARVRLLIDHIETIARLARRSPFHARQLDLN